MTDAFWNGFNQGFGAVQTLRQSQARAKYAKTGDLNALMAVNPDEGQRLQGQAASLQRQDVSWTQQQADRTATMDAGRQAGGGDLKGAQERLLAAGNFEGAQHVAQLIAQGTEHDKAVLAEQVQRGLPFFYGMSRLSEAQRPAWAQAHAAAFGIDPTGWGPEAYSDASVDAHLASGMGTLKMLELDLRKDKSKADQGYRNALLEETKHYHADTIAVRRAHLGVKPTGRRRKRHRSSKARAG